MYPIRYVYILEKAWHCKTFESDYWLIIRIPMHKVNSFVQGFSCRHNINKTLLKWWY